MAEPTAEPEAPEDEAGEKPDGLLDPETGEPIPTLAEKLVEVMAEVEFVEKDGHNDFHEYDYTTAEAMLKAIRGPLQERGILLHTSIGGVEKQGSLTSVQMTCTFVDSETGEQRSLLWYGTGDDKGDKGLYKAYTGGLKTFLRAQFLLPMEHDPEADESTDKRGAGENGAEPRKLPTDAAARLDAIVAKSGRSESEYKTKLRAFGVNSVTELTVEQGLALHEWATEGEDKE